MVLILEGEMLDYRCMLLALRKGYVQHENHPQTLHLASLCTRVGNGRGIGETLACGRATLLQPCAADETRRGRANGRHGPFRF